MQSISRLLLVLSLSVFLCPAQTAPGGVISRLAGCGTCDYTPDGAAALSSRLTEPVAVAISASGEIYFSEHWSGPLVQSSGGRVRKLTTAGNVVAVAGNGQNGDWGNPHDGAQATAVGMMPSGIALDAAGNLYIADRSSERIRKVAPNGVITTAAQLSLSAFAGLAIDAGGNLYTSVGGSKIVKVAPNGTVTTVAGTDSLGFGGDGGLATSALLNIPTALALDPAGNLYIADESNNRIRKVTPAGIITTVAGNGVGDVYVPNGDGGPALSAVVPSPKGIAVDAAGNLFISQWMRVRRVAPDGTITTVVNRDEHDYNEKEVANFCCTGLLATSSNVEDPEGLAVDSAGNLYIANGPNENLLLKVTAERYSAGPQPQITAAVNAADYTSILAPGAWVAIMGTGLAPVTRPWADADIVNNALPQQLDNVRVYVEGWPAIVSYISPTQINALVFHRGDAQTWQLSGQVPVEVINSNGRSAVFAANRNGCSPALFRLPVDGGKWAIAYAYSDGALIGPPGILPGTYTRPARAGDILTLYGTGFGPTSPAIAAGTIVTTPAQLASDVRFRTDYVTVRPEWAGLVMAGLYQFNFTVPAGIPDGSYQFTPSACQGTSGAPAWLAFQQ